MLCWRSGLTQRPLKASFTGPNPVQSTILKCTLFTGQIVLVKGVMTKLKVVVRYIEIVMSNIFLAEIYKNNLIDKTFKKLEPLSGEINHCLDAFLFYN